MSRMCDQLNPIMSNFFVTDFRHTEELHLISYFCVKRGRWCFYWWSWGRGIAPGHMFCPTDTFCYLSSYFGWSNFFLPAGLRAEKLSIIVGQEPTVLAVGAGRGCADNFLGLPIVSLFFLPLPLEGDSI